MGRTDILRIGVDIGSTTVKLVAVARNGKLLLWILNLSGYVLQMF